MTKSAKKMNCKMTQKMGRYEVGRTSVKMRASRARMAAIEKIALGDAEGLAKNMF